MKANSNQRAKGSVRPPTAAQNRRHADERKRGREQEFRLSRKRHEWLAQNPNDVVGRRKWKY